jgi:hypothetical protein
MLMPRRPPSRSGEISDELLSTFDNVLIIQNMIEKLQEELKPLNKRLEWTLMPEAFGDHWSPHNMMSSTDPSLDHDPPLGSRRSDVEEWPALRRDRQTLLKAGLETAETPGRWRWLKTSGGSLRSRCYR